MAYVLMYNAICEARRYMDNQVTREIDFSVFALHHLARAWGMSVPDTYRALQDAGIIDDYLVPFYDVLHTLGAEYLVNDLTGMARDRGVAV